MDQDYLKKLDAVTTAFNQKFAEYIEFLHVVVPEDRNISKMRTFVTVFNLGKTKRTRDLLISSCNECISKEFGRLIDSNHNYLDLIKTITAESLDEILNKSVSVKKWKNADAQEPGADKAWIKETVMKYFHLIQDPCYAPEHKDGVWNYIVVLNILCRRYDDLISKIHGSSSTE